MTKSTDHTATKKSGFALSGTYGVSMRPLIWGGQHCVASIPLDGEPTIGDLLIFRQTLPNGKKMEIVHRLVDKSKDKDKTLYITRGDNCFGAETVSRGDIIGKVIEIHRLTGFRPWHIIPFKKISVTDPTYRLYTRFWQAIWPARKIIYILRAKAQNIRNRLLSLFKKKQIQTSTSNPKR